MSIEPKRRAGLMLAATLLGGCVQPPCEETYSPLVKVLFGAPLPVLITLGFAFAAMHAIDLLLLRDQQPRFDALVAFALACVAPCLVGLVLPPGPAAMAWLLSFSAAMVLGLRHRGQDANQASWTHALSDTLEPSLATRITVVALVFVLALISMIGTGATLFSISRAGQRCDTVLKQSPGSPPSAGS